MQPSTALIITNAISFCLIGFSAWHLASGGPWPHYITALMAIATLLVNTFHIHFMVEELSLYRRRYDIIARRWR